MLLFHPEAKQAPEAPWIAFQFSITFQLELMISSKVLATASGYSLEGEASELLSLGCRSFLQKPFEIEELSDTIQHALHSE
jgi:CheY-like chemotaxis protein